MSLRSVEIAIFSFNRGDNLRVCVDSILRNAPDVKFTIYDDRSDDPQTLKYLEEISHFVVTPSATDKHRHGGLYRNMNLALERSTHPYLMTLQDDMQLVREFKQSDDEAIRGIFDFYPNIGFVSQLFMRGSAMRRYKRRLEPAERVRAYISPLHERCNQKASLAYFDCHIANTERLKRHGWFYCESEAANVNQALSKFGPMPCMADPVAFFCPDVPFYRNRNRNGLSSYLAGKLLGRNAKYFNDLTEDELKRFKSRDLSEWPVAEYYLTSPFSTVKKPFTYHDVKARWWLYLLHKFEEKLQKTKV